MGVGVKVEVGLRVRVGVTTRVGARVGVGVRVDAGVGVRLGVGVRVDADLRVRLGVGVGVDLTSAATLTGVTVSSSRVVYVAVGERTATEVGVDVPRSALPNATPSTKTTPTRTTPAPPITATQGGNPVSDRSRIRVSPRGMGGNMLPLEPACPSRD